MLLDKKSPSPKRSLERFTLVMGSVFRFQSPGSRGRGERPQPERSGNPGERSGKRSGWEVLGLRSPVTANCTQNEPEPLQEVKWERGQSITEFHSEPPFHKLEPLNERSSSNSQTLPDPDIFTAPMKLGLLFRSCKDG